MITVLINGRTVMSIKDATQYSSIDPRYYGQCIDVGVDQSKSHTAMVIGPAGFGYSDYIEIMDSGGDTNVFDVCAVTRRLMFDVFKGATFRAIGIEDPITKNYNETYRDKNGVVRQRKTGMDTHENRIKLTSIFANFMFIFYDLSGKHPMRVNNEDWKAGVLPEEYRKISKHKKGSLDWHRDRGTVLSMTNDNVTDAACILDYIRKINKDVKATLPITGAELPKESYVYQIRDYSDKVKVNTYQYNNTLSFVDNISFVRNRIKKDGVGAIVLPAEDIPIDELYKETCSLSNPNASAVLLLVGGA